MSEYTDHEIPGNGSLKTKDKNCPFYELGGADFHEYRKEMVTELKRLNNTMTTQCSLLAEALQCAYSRSTGVPLKTHLYTILAVISGMVGADVLQALFSHIK